MGTGLIRLVLQQYFLYRSGLVELGRLEDLPGIGDGYGCRPNWIPRVGWEELYPVSMRPNRAGTYGMFK